MRKETGDWMTQAGAERKTAADNLEKGNFYATAFHAQQCAEDALKAVFIERKGELPPKTHSLLLLAEALAVPAALRHALTELSPLYLFSRYPDTAGAAPATLYHREEALRFLQQATEVLAWAKERLR